MTSFIDFHVHPPVDAFLNGPLAPYRAELERARGRPLPEMSGEELAEYYRRRDGRAVLLGWDGTAVTGRSLTGATVARLVSLAPDVFHGLGSVDPLGGSAAVAAVHDSARLGLRGLSFHPAAQGFTPSDRRVNPVWEVAAEHGMICLVHTGLTRLGMGLPGGGAVLLDHARPVHLDAVAARYPALALVISHHGSLWLDEAIAVALHKPNVYLELAGQLPSRMPRELRKVVAGPLAARALFGSGFPFAAPDDWIAEWEALEMNGGLTAALLAGNAAALLARPVSS